jgi:hypothetical protein
MCIQVEEQISKIFGYTRTEKAEVLPKKLLLEETPSCLRTVRCCGLFVTADVLFVGIRDVVRV